MAAKVGRKHLKFEAPVVTLRGLSPLRKIPSTPPTGTRSRGLAHGLLDEALAHLRTVGERPVWQPVPEAVRRALGAPLPVAGQGAERPPRRRST